MISSLDNHETIPVCCFLIAIQMHIITCTLSGELKDICESKQFPKYGYNFTNINKNFMDLSNKIWNVSRERDRILDQLSMKAVHYNAASKPKQIWLEWGPSFWGLKAGEGSFFDCNVRDCYILQRGAGGLEVDARIFSEGVNFLDLPHLNKLKRTYSQIWIIHALESPMASANFKELDKIFNWTATYRLDSTIVTPYAKWKELLSEGEVPDIGPVNYAKNKTKKAIAFMSNCNTSNDRLKYVKELSKYIDIDIYGECGNLDCKKSDMNLCHQKLKKYKFYLAFENSNCRDYITEKLYINAFGYVQV